MPAGSLTDRGENLLLQYIFNDVALPAIDPHFGLATSATPTDSTFTEMTGSGYARVQIDNTYFSASTTGSTSNTLEISFPRSTGFTGTVFGIGLFEDDTQTTPLVYWETPDQETIVDGNAFSLPSGSVNFSFDPSSKFSTYLQNLIINWLFRGEAWTITNVSFSIGYCTTAPTASAFGTEPAGGSGYSQKTISRSAIQFPITGNVATWDVDLTFDTATADQGSVQHIGYFDGAQFLAWGETSSPLTINTNGSLTVGTGTTFTLN